MQTVVLTEILTDPFTLPSLATGQTFTRTASYIDGASSVFNPSSTPEVGGGSYLFVYTPLVAGSFIWIGDATNGDRIMVTFRVVTAAQADPAAYIAAGNVSILSPVGIDLGVTVYESDSYDTDESRALEWSTTDAGTWPTLTSATIALKAVHTRDGKTISATGSVVTATGATKQVRVELAPADTSAKPSGEYDYQVIATLPNTHVVTLAAGTLTLTERIRV